MKKAVIVLLLLLSLHLHSFCEEDKYRGKWNCAFDYNEIPKGFDVFHIASQFGWLILEDGDDYYMPPDDPNDFTPIEEWPHYIKGKNEAPEVIACNGNKKLLKLIMVYRNYRLTPYLWADEKIRDLITERLERNLPGYYDDDERFVAPDSEEGSE